MALLKEEPAGLSRLGLAFPNSDARSHWSSFVKSLIFSLRRCFTIGDPSFFLCRVPFVSAALLVSAFHDWPLWSCE
ncbi:MAG: hypothetical protein DMG13_12410 [Acidobacteria bacterium]|nr:MAG: hypothetical protein DMG13_12410 [Acidobacteriota bacterium]